MESAVVGRGLTLGHLGLDGLEDVLIGRIEVVAQGTDVAEHRRGVEVLGDAGVHERVLGLVADDHDADRRGVEDGTQIVLTGRGAGRVASRVRRGRGGFLERVGHEPGQHASDQHDRNTQQTGRHPEARSRGDADADGIGDDERIGAAQPEHQRVAHAEDREPGHEVDEVPREHRRHRNQQAGGDGGSNEPESLAGAVDQAEQAEGAPCDRPEQHGNRHRPHRGAQQVVSAKDDEEQRLAARHQPTQLLRARGVGRIVEAVHHLDLRFGP